MIQITHAKWSNHSIGIAERHLHGSETLFEVTIKGHEGIYRVNGADAIRRYGITQINKPALFGVFIPLKDLPEYRVKMEVEA